MSVYSAPSDDLSVLDGYRRRVDALTVGVALGNVAMMFEAKQLLDNLEAWAEVRGEALGAQGLNPDDGIEECFERARAWPLASVMSVLRGDSCVSECVSDLPPIG